jgi:hypothetical protein
VRERSRTDWAKRSLYCSLKPRQCRPWSWFSEERRGSGRLHMGQRHHGIAKWDVGNNSENRDTLSQSLNFNRLDCEKVGCPGGPGPLSAQSRYTRPSGRGRPRVVFRQFVIFGPRTKRPEIQTGMFKRAGILGRRMATTRLRGRAFRSGVQVTRPTTLYLLRPRPHLRRDSPDQLQCELNLACRCRQAIEGAGVTDRIPF